MTWGIVELEPEVREWLEQLPAARFATVAFYVDLLAEYGPLLDEPYTRQLDGKLRELRFHLDGQAVRVTYWIASGRRIALLRCSTRLGCATTEKSNGLARLWLDVLRKNTLRERTRAMPNRTAWAEIKDRRMREPGAREAYQVARLAYELGRTVRGLREQRTWSQAELGAAAGMTQSAVARFEAGGTVPSLPVLERLARALNADLIVQMTPRTDVA